MQRIVHELFSAAMPSSTRVTSLPLHLNPVLLDKRKVGPTTDTITRLSWVDKGIRSDWGDGPVIRIHERQSR
jgi:hypothetical protein